MMPGAKCFAPGTLAEALPKMLCQYSNPTPTSLTVVGNLAASLENRHKNVNARLYWDAGHGADEDVGDFIAWIGKITGYKGGN